jgi:threonine aldolase
MRKAMAEADVGDDHYGEDPTVNRLQEEFADRLGKSAALFVPSGTMANQLAVRVLTRPGDAVIAGAHQHVVCYENAAAPANSGVGFMLLDDSTGTVDPAAVLNAATATRYHYPRATLVAVEDTHMAAGGAVWPAGVLAEVARVSHGSGLALHLDGARLWHSEVTTGRAMSELAAPATTVMCCLSKALGAPVGSLLAGPADLIDAARVERHRLGGAMRQAGVIAAAGLVAMREMTSRLPEDHARASRLALAVAERWPDSGFDPEGVRTNLVVFPHDEPSKLLAHLEARGVLAGSIEARKVRLVTHYDVDDAGIEHACQALAASPV